MKYKSTLLVICLIICFLSMAGASASDLNDTVMANDNDLIENDVLTSSESPILEGSSTGTFTDLANEIAYAGGKFSLTRNYTYGSGDSGYKNGITIDKSIIINGNGFSVNGNNAARAFNIRANDVTLNNCNFVDCFNYDSGGAVYWSGADGTLSDCSFVNNLDNMINDNGVHCGGAVYWSGANGTLENSNFEDCIVSEFNEGTSASSYGGAVYWKGVNGTLSDCSFIHCEARAYADQEEYYDEMYHNNPRASSYGGAVYWSGADGIVKDCSFVDCRAYAYAYFSSSDGGGICFSGKNCSLINPIFENNSAESGPDWYSSQPLMYHIPSGTFTDLANEIAGAVGEFNLTRNYTYSDNDSNYNGGIRINKSIVINGNGFTLDGNNKTRIFRISNDNVVLNDITFINGYSDYGGAIFWTTSNVNIFNCYFVNNKAEGAGGANYFKNEVINSSINATFINNSVAEEWGGANYFCRELTNVYFSANFINNTAKKYAGANYFADRLTNVSLSGNFIDNCAIELGGGANYFDGILNDVSLVGNFTSNKAGGNGGANYFKRVIKNSSLIGNFTGNQANVSGGANYFGSDITKSSISGVFINNTAKDNGGAISFNFNIKLTKVVLSGIFVNNTSQNDGGAISIHGTLTNFVLSCNFINNTAKNTAGAIFISHLHGVLSIVNSTFINNHAMLGGGAVGSIALYANVTIVDSNFIGNYVGGNDYGGGAIYLCTYTSNSTGKSNLSIINSLFEENTAIEKGGAIFAGATTVNVSNSVFIKNKDSANITVYGSISYGVNPNITLNDNWWGSNDNPNDCVGGDDNYKPAISRWVILTATNETPIVEGSTVILTVNLDTYTDGEETGALENPIIIPRDVTIMTTFDTIEGVLENGEFTTEYMVPADLKLIAASVDDEEVLMFRAKLKANLNITDILIDQYNYAKILIRIDDAIEGNVTFVVNGDGVSYTENVAIAEGSAIYTTPDALGAGKYNVLVIFEGNDDYYADAADETFNLDKINTTLTVPDVAIYNVTNNLVVATLKDSYGNVVSGVKVKLVVGSLSKIGRTDENGQISLDVSGLEVGRYTIAARSAVTDVYNEAKVYAVAFISEGKVDTALTIPDVFVVANSSGTVVATLKDVYGNLISGVKVKIVVGSLSKIARTDANGQVSMDISGLEIGEYKISARSAVTDIYNEAKATAKAIIVDKLNTTLTIPDVFAVCNESGVVVATLKDSYGNLISGVKVKIVVGSLSKIARTDENGQVSMDISSLAPGEYKISARSSATNDFYNEAKATAKAVVYADKIDTTLTIPDVDIQYGDEGAFAVATLKDASGNIISGVKVKLVVGNLTKIARTDENGQISLDVSGLAPGEYKISARSAVTDIYKEAKASAKATINKADTTLTIHNVEISQGIPGAVAVATLKDANGKVVSGVKVKIVVGDLSKIARTDANGQVSIDISSLAAGEYKIAARSAVTDFYNEAKGSAKAIITAN